MPAQRFFAMLDAKREIEKQEYAIAVDIAGVAIGGQKWYDHLKEVFAPKRINDIQFPENPITLGVMDAASDAAKNVVMDIFAAKKRIGGPHGRN